MVSHNRFLVRAVADRLILVKPSGIEEFTGGYEEYLEKGREDYLKASKKTTKIKQQTAKPKLSYEEQKRLKSELKRKTRTVNKLEADYQSLEAKNNHNMALIFDYEKFSQLSKDDQKDVMQKKSQLEKKLSEALTEWEKQATELENLKMEIDGQDSRK